MWFAEDRLVRKQAYLFPGWIVLNTTCQGPERVKGLYAFRNILDSGARITLGSDFPVEGVNPLAGFYAAITRVASDGSSPHGPSGWYVVSISSFRQVAKIFPCPHPGSRSNAWRVKKPFAEWQLTRHMRRSQKISLVPLYLAREQIMLSCQRIL